MMPRLIDTNPFLLAVAGFLIILVVVIYYLYRRGENSLKKLGFIPIEYPAEELREITKTYLDREPSFVYVQHLLSPLEAGNTYYMKLESTSDEGQLKCVAVRVEAGFRKRIIIYRFYGSKRLFRIAQKLLFRFEYSHIKKVPLIELTDFNEQYLDRYGLFAFGDDDFDLQDSFFQRIIHLLCSIDLQRTFAVGLLGHYLLIVSDSRQSALNLWERLKPILRKQESRLHF
jgi:hypothetical protein